MSLDRGCGWLGAGSIWGSSWTIQGISPVNGWLNMEHRGLAWSHKRLETRVLAWYEVIGAAYVIASATQHVNARLSSGKPNVD